MHICKRKMIAALLTCGVLAVNATFAADGSLDSPADAPSARPRLIVRADDMGFCHAANMAFKRILEEGVCTSVSVMVTTPWLDEAVAILRDHPDVSVGVHLTLNSEWREYRWGPVLPYSEVPSLVDAQGKFFGTRSAFMANHPKPDEVARELRAQIELARSKGLPISYVDYHMGTAVSTREFQEIVEQLAKEYELGMSRYFGETDAPSVYRATPDQKLAAGLEIVRGLHEPKLYLFVVHPGRDVPEMQAMTDLNDGGLEDMAAHRQAEADLLCSAEFKRAIEEGNIDLVGYSDLKSAGLDQMKRPWLADSYATVQAQTAETAKP